MTTVYNVSTEQTLDYTLSPREAVMAAFAQETRKDFNTWDYEKRYGNLVRKSPHGWVCGDFWAKEAQ